MQKYYIMMKIMSYVFVVDIIEHQNKLWKLLNILNLLIYGVLVVL